MRVKKIEILYEDKEVIVCRKPAGVATQSARAGQQDMVSLLKNERVRKKEEPYIGLVHRLDQPVEGVMVFAKTKQAAAVLSRQVAERGMDKYYLAVAEGCLANGACQLEQPLDVGMAWEVFSGAEMQLEHMLIKEERQNCSRLAKPGEAGAKQARLAYQVLAYEKEQDVSLVRIKLDTGRHHQIRVQFSALGHPLVGDQKYNPKAQMGQTALCSYRIGFVHPSSKKGLEFQILPENPQFQIFKFHPLTF